MTVPLIGPVVCYSFTEAKPVYPDVGNPYFPTVVDSLKPTFQWQARPDALSYDLIVYDAIKTKMLFGANWSVGREVYYREALQGSTHTMVEALKPDTRYYWSVRVRRQMAVLPWSRYNYDSNNVHLHNQFFDFDTPAASQ
jgi:hypothetical protein